MLLEKVTVCAAARQVEELICRELQTVDLAEWKQQQELDTDLQPALQWVEAQQWPLWEEVVVFSKATKGLWSQFEVLCLCQGVLQRAWKEPATGEKRWQRTDRQGSEGENQRTDRQGSEGENQRTDRQGSEGENQRTDRQGSEGENQRTDRQGSEGENQRTDRQGSEGENQRTDRQGSEGENQRTGRRLLYGDIRKRERKNKTSKI
ncbi:hypothetical protein NHX12_030796 [Muraenolepis orangiensis]|uniref:Uncharacterized protein n=1 Tax=Muraenolepis orangiensis TaxID=630683 RepID=A0A9Q0E8E0_9TELE|nr:hypothetical protein NHX12_030796 [Muraenolepis orangiensis]